MHHSLVSMLPLPLSSVFVPPPCPSHVKPLLEKNQHPFDEVSPEGPWERPGPGPPPHLASLQVSEQCGWWFSGPPAHPKPLGIFEQR